MKIADGELRQLLSRDLKLTPETVRELAADAKQSGHSLLHTTLASRVVSEQTIARAYAKRLGIPFADLEELPIVDKHVRRLPRKIAVKHHIICFDESPTSVKVAMADPRDEAARTAVRHYYGKTVRRYLATSKGLIRAMQSYKLADTTPLPLSTRELITTILDQAQSNNSRDIHFEPHGHELIIRRRTGKRLVDVSTLPLVKARGLIAWCKLQSGGDVADTERAWHGTFQVRMDGVRQTIAVSTIPVVGGEKMTLRIVSAADSVPSFTDIGFGKAEAGALADFVKDGAGLIVIAGGHGADVPTTLAALAKCATQQVHTTVATVEHPLQYQLPGATQTEVTDHLSFAQAVADSIAQNPSTLVVPELGSSEASQSLADFSLSQHLVISGLYATSLHSALTKIMARPVAPALLAASLRLVVVQHYLDKLCRNCRKPFAPAGPLKQVLRQQFGFAADAKLYRQGRGCNRCHRGADGTILAYEWLPITHELQQLLATGADQQTIAAYLQSHSNFTNALGKLAARGNISIDEATSLVDHSVAAQ